MKTPFKQLGFAQRFALAYMLKDKVNKNMIAQKLGVHRSTVYREIKRNSDPQFGYHILLAEQKAKRRQLDQKQRKMDRNSALKAYVIDQLKDGWSPEQIAGRLKLKIGKTMICYETIYTYIYSPQGKAEGLYQYLYRRKPKRYPKIGRRTHSPIPNRTSILQRPLLINDRLEFGHWEADFMLFKKGIKTNLITLRERKTRLLIAIKNNNRCAGNTASILLNTLQRQYKQCVKSITFDNDVGFAQHERIAKTLNANTYFCEPYKSYQKGSIENGNGLLRKFFPRESDIENLDQFTIDRFVYRLNTKPMKSLNFQTPYEVFKTLKS